MMSDGYICTPGDLALSLNSSVPLVYCLTRGQSFGLLVEWFFEIFLPILLTPGSAECRISHHIADRCDIDLCPTAGE